MDTDLFQFMVTADNAVVTIPYDHILAHSYTWPWPEGQEAIGTLLCVYRLVKSLPSASEELKEFWILIDVAKNGFPKLLPQFKLSKACEVSVACTKNRYYDF